MLKNVTFSVEEGETVGIIGANGAGKSTLLKLLVGLLFPDPMAGTAMEDGWISVDHQQVTPKSLSRIRQQIGYVFQDSDIQLFMPTVAEDVGFAPKNYGFSKQEVAQRVTRALQMTGTYELRDRSCLELSGGQKKLVSLATVLSMSPPLLIFDEPTSALDPKNRRLVMNVFRSLPETRMIVSHDLDLVLDLCNRVILLCDGKIVRDGNARDILSDENLLEENGLELPLRLQK